MAKKTTTKKEKREISREERVTGKAPAGTVEGLDKDSREYHVLQNQKNKGDK